MITTSPPGLDLGALGRYLVDRGELTPEVDLSASALTGGRSNLTYLVDLGGRKVVLRRPPLGHVLASAHDMGREFRVLTGLASSKVPTPAPVLHCSGTDVIGAEFFVMEFIQGTGYRWATELAVVGPERTRSIATGLIDTLADLHAVDPEAVGLGELGRPEGFLRRQVDTWKRQLDRSRSRDLPGLDELHARLDRSVPTETDSAIVHGDYRLDNLLFDEADELVGVLDWEMATLGDPLTDLALMVAYDSLPAGSGIAPDTAHADGYPSVADLLERYADRSGRDLGQIDFYLDLAYFKLSVILEGIHFRFLNGGTVGEGFDQVGDLVPGLIEAGLERKIRR